MALLFSKTPGDMLFCNRCNINKLDWSSKQIIHEDPKTDFCIVSLLPTVMLHCCQKKEHVYEMDLSVSSSLQYLVCGWVRML